jgi:hypothetical protein
MKPKRHTRSGLDSHQFAYELRAIHEIGDPGLYIQAIIHKFGNVLADEAHTLPPVERRVLAQKMLETFAIEIGDGPAMLVMANLGLAEGLIPLEPNIEHQGSSPEGNI